MTYSIPTDFASWQETHYEVVAFITSYIHHHPDFDGSTIANRYLNQGTGGMYELAEEWTNEFQDKFRDHEWDGEFFDEIEHFLTTKNNG